MSTSLRGSNKTSLDLIYLDSSALVKLIVNETESEELSAYISTFNNQLATSAIAQIEVFRAVKVATTAEKAERETADLLAACFIINIDKEILHHASYFTSQHVRSIDAIHLASAVAGKTRLFVAYDKRLLAAADHHGLRTAQPGV